MTSITNSQPPLVKRLLFFVKTLKIILKYQSNHIKNLIKLIISSFFIKNCLNIRQINVLLPFITIYKEYSKIKKLQ
ncbi:hypothetical protein A9Z60_01120 [Moraxella nonliquefaciens]|uniref:Uncharacterized protein n=1 Tax=Moraxella nonliquefaciens TaxID=478 RepID=A0A1B8PMM8_MORNO|nr:hypothetical protein A9Z60_01120 [Moraxella nonliquefaciens]